jgi:hypothetical protein
MISIFCLMARFPDSSGVGNGPTKCADLAEANIVEQNDNNIGHTLGRRRDPGPVRLGIGVGLADRALEFGFW